MYAFILKGRSNPPELEETNFAQICGEMFCCSKQTILFVAAGLLFTR